MTPEWTATNRNGRRQKLASIILLLTYFATVLANQEPESHTSSDNSIEPNPNIVGEQPSAADKRTPWSYAFAPSDSYSYSYLPISADEIYNSLRPSKRGLDDAQSREC
uniref:Uncharacterized protein n=1 Tax=Ditylenchus dipsaci TaxID=166011 RepID=A0A915D2D1_9BILA